jgi:hypothetical protein
MNLLEQMAKDIALDLREEAVAAADLEEEEDHEVAATAEAEPEEGDQAVIESEPVEPPSASEGGDGAVESGGEEREMEQQPLPSDSHLHQQPAAGTSPVSASRASNRKRRATVPRSSASSAEVPGAAEPPPRRKRARPAVGDGRDAPQDAVASRTRARIRQAPYGDAAHTSDHRSDSPVRALARGGALGSELDVPWRTKRAASWELTATQ